jgi:uncharacterized protein
MERSYFLRAVAAGNRPALKAYPDTSLLIATLVEETGSARADAWLDQNRADLVLSGWLDIELASALAGKARLGTISDEQMSAALALYDGRIRPGSGRLSITEPIFTRAAIFIRDASGLRAGDALHLAIAEAHDALLTTADKRQAELGAQLGVKTQLL